MSVKSRHIIAICWSIVVIFSLPFLLLISICHKKTRGQIRGRTFTFLRICYRLYKSDFYRNSYVFFCSSAGEYEQACPLLDKLPGERKQMLVVFFSQSGYRFAALKKEPALFFLSPPDIVWVWQIFFTLARPRATIVVRHELWPAFLAAASNKSKLYLVNASFPQTKNSVVKKFLLLFFARIFVVSKADQLTLQKKFSYPPPHIIIAGDSKYDRVRQRTAATKSLAAGFLSIKKDTTRKKLLIGSAWHSEVIAVLTNYRQMQKNWQVLIAPHEPDEKMLSWIENLCLQYSLASCRYTKLSTAPSSSIYDFSVITIDVLGCLTELYQLADLAIVGGGMDKKVHNVLEPAFHGVPTAIGKNFTNSSEAKLLVQKNLIDVIDAHSILTWWQRKDHPGAELSSFVSSLCGATEIICADIDRTA